MSTEEITNSIKQLIISSGKFMQEASTFEQAEERILHLEENDDQFHKYDLVKFLKAEIDECIAPIVDEEIERYSENGPGYLSDSESLVARITEKVIKSPQFAQIKIDLTKTVAEAVDRLVDNFEEEFQAVRKGESPPNTPRQRDPYHFSDEESTLSGSYNHGGYMFVTHEQLQKNIEHLDKKNNIQTRRAALTDLIHMSLNDVLSNDESYQRQWNSLERGVIDALGEQEDSVLPKIALKFISQGFASSHGNTKELYSILVNFLHECFCNKSITIPKLKNGVDCKKQDTVSILSAIRLMNDFQRYIPSYWVRLSTRFLHELLDTTLKLLSLGHGPANPDIQTYHTQQMTPIHFIALLDPKAEWFIGWTHGCYSRLPLFNMMKTKQYSKFLEHLVRSILEFAAARNVPFDLLSETSESFASFHSTVGSQQKRSTYTGDEIEYLYFVHAINIVGRILLFKQGAKLFPIRISGYEDEITITKLMCTMAQLVTNPGGHGPATRSITAVYEPSVLATEILKRLCSSEAMYQICFCKDSVTQTLLAPIRSLTEPGMQDGSTVTDASLLNIADVLSILASKTHGRRHLLYGEKGGILSKTRTSAAHCLVDFCKRLLTNSPPSISLQVSRPVCGAYLFLCRQLYNNGEGLQALYSYDLHSVIGQAWSQASKSLNSLVSPESLSAKESDKFRWEEMLRDSLLSFSTTPKGVLLMQQSCAMHACTEYMCKRHKQRHQVSKLEKFGYGSVITQIAGTACGMLELDKQGLIHLLCSDAWNSIEPGEQFDVPFQPKMWPVDPIEKTSYKPLVNLVHVLSSFMSVFELIGGEKLPHGTQLTCRDAPASLLELLDRISIINTQKDENKIHFLFNYEQSHMFGLNLLNYLVSCLDTQLLLESQFKIIDTLLESQFVQDLETGNKKLVFDELTMQRNHVIARCLVIGGPNERVIPPHTFPNNKTSELKYSMIQTKTAPKEYLPNLAGKSSMKQETELTRFLMDTRSKHDAAWVERCKKAFESTLAAKPDSIKGNVQDLLEKAVSALNMVQNESLFTTSSSDSDSGVKSFKLTNMQELGIKKAVQYGAHLKLLGSVNESEENLSKLLRHTGHFLKQQQRQVSSHIRSLGHNYVGFDWFLATIFILMRGNFDKSWKFMQSFANVTASTYLWGPRMHRSIHLPAALASSGISPVLYSACHNVELILQIELPVIYSAFKMSGYTASQVCQLWIRQCFWNFLDWAEICYYIALCILMGIDYQVYICVAMLKHLQQDILVHQQKQDLAIFLREHPIRNFKVEQNLQYFKYLEKKYRKTVLSDMMSLSKP